MTQSGDPLNGAISGLVSGKDAEPTAFEPRDDQECAEFQDLMPTRIGNGEDLQSYAHMQTCERCRALLNDLEEIAKVARELIPVEAEPRDDLWVRIESKLAMEQGDA